MIVLGAPDFADVAPFPHYGWDQVLPESTAHDVLAWFENDAPWNLRIASFYEQYEFSLLVSSPPAVLEALVSADTIAKLASDLRELFKFDRDLVLVDVSAHRLTAGQTIRVHNDYLGSEETHRLLIQFNCGWSIEDGGLLMLFGSDAAKDIHSALLPSHGSAFAFEISPRSFHAVSKVNAGERYTLVYTFRAAID